MDAAWPAAWLRVKPALRLSVSWEVVKIVYPKNSHEIILEVGEISNDVSESLHAVA